MTSGSVQFPEAFVVDANVLVKVFLPEQDSEVARRLIQHAVSTPGSCSAPDLIYPECGNILWKKERQGLLTAERMREITREIVAIPIAIWPGRQLLESAAILALSYGITAYDASYLALSRLLNIPLVSADERLLRQAGGPGDRLIPLASLR
jgi:predicted nucleic acid-binding protein